MGFNGPERNCKMRKEESERPLRVQRMAAVRLPVRDVEENVRFLREVLGLVEVRRRRSPKGTEAVILKPVEGETEIELVWDLEGHQEMAGRQVVLAFFVEDLEAWKDRIQGLGIRWTVEPVYEDDGGGWAILTMPAGYRVELRQRSGIYLA